jgi:signal peptidase II
MSDASAAAAAAKGTEGAGRTPKPVPVSASGWRWLPLSAAVVLVDHLAKAWIMHHFEPLERVHVLKVLDIILTFNTGAAFSFLADAAGWQRWFFAGLAVIVGLGIVVWLRRLNARTQWLLALGLSFILAGAMGNLIDRLRLGHVIDFIEAHWMDASFPAFNVADSAITVGAALIILDAWIEGRRRRP